MIEELLTVIECSDQKEYLSQVVHLPIQVNGLTDTAQNTTFRLWTRAQKEKDRDLAALSSLPEEDIDTSEIPEVMGWSRAVVGEFYRPIKENGDDRLDADCRL